MIELGPASAVAEPVARLHSDLDALCGRQLPPQLDRVIRRSVRTQVTALDRILLAPLGPRLGDLDVVVVPTGALSAIPWGLLPTLHGRPVTVTPSSSAWFDAGPRSGRATGAPLLVAGSDLTHADIRGLADATRASTSSPRPAARWSASSPTTARCARR